MDIGSVLEKYILILNVKSGLLYDYCNPGKSNCLCNYTTEWSLYEI